LASPALFESLLDTIRAKFDVADDCEVR
jgi:hypothetical protein